MDQIPARQSQYCGVAIWPNHNFLTSSRLKNQSSYALAHTLDESLTALLLRSFVWLSHEARDSVVEPKAELLPRDYHSAANTGDLIWFADGFVVVQSRRVSESLGQAHTEIHWRLESCFNDTRDILASIKAHSKCGLDVEVLL